MTKKFYMLTLFGLLLSALPGTVMADTLILRSGTRISGTLVRRTSKTITFRNSRGTVRRYKASSVQDVQVDSANQNYPNNNSNGQTRSAAGDRQPEVLPAGTQIVIVTNEQIDSNNSRQGQTFSAQVDQDVVDSSNELIVPKGSPAALIIRSAASGGVTGNPEITLDINSLTVRGRRYTVSTRDLQQKGSGGIGKNKRTAEYIGGGAVAGTIIGAILGHGKGAAIGAAAGAAAGAGVQVLTKGKEVRVPAETILRFNLDQAVTLAPE